MKITLEFKLFSNASTRVENEKQSIGSEKKKNYN